MKTELSEETTSFIFKLTEFAEENWSAFCQRSIVDGETEEEFDELLEKLKGELND